MTPTRVNSQTSCLEKRWVTVNDDFVTGEVIPQWDSWVKAIAESPHAWQQVVIHASLDSNIFHYLHAIYLNRFYALNTKLR